MNNFTISSVQKCHWYETLRPDPRRRDTESIQRGNGRDKSKRKERIKRKKGIQIDRLRQNHRIRLKKKEYM